MGRLTARQRLFGFLEGHLNRLCAGVRMIFMDMGEPHESFDKKLKEAVDANDMVYGVYVRLMVTIGNKKPRLQDHRLTVTSPKSVIIPEYKITITESKRSGVRLFASKIRRESQDYLDQRLNYHSKLYEVTAPRQTIRARVNEALMVDINSSVSTCNATKFFIVRNGEVWTSTGSYCTNGVTRSEVISVCEKREIVVRQKDFSMVDLYGEDEAFVTGKFRGLTPVVEVDRQRLPCEAIPGEMTSRLSDLYNQEVEDYIE